jgi:hypothetical protein
MSFIQYSDYHLNNLGRFIVITDRDGRLHDMIHIPSFMKAGIIVRATLRF